MMSNKALRLPIILLALIIMVSVVQAFRPKEKLETQLFRDPNIVETFKVTQTGDNITINGHKASEFVNQTSSYKPLSLAQPKNWNVSDIQRIEVKGSNHTLVFTDGSTQTVTSIIYQQLPSAIQVRLSYDRQN